MIPVGVALIYSTWCVVTVTFMFLPLQVIYTVDAKITYTIKCLRSILHENIIDIFPSRR